MTPLQTAAQALIERWDSPDWKHAPTADYIKTLRDALEDEVAQVAEPVCSQCKGLGYYDEGHENDDGSMSGGNYVDCGKCHPPQPQATTPVPELLEELENCRDLLKIAFPDAPVDSCIGVGIIKASAAIAAAQGEKL